METPGPDQLDVQAEEAAVSAIDVSRTAISVLEAFDHIAHISGVFSVEALDKLNLAERAVRKARDDALAAFRFQAEADSLRRAVSR